MISYGVLAASADPIESNSSSIAVDAKKLYPISPALAFPPGLDLAASLHVHITGVALKRVMPFIDDGNTTVNAFELVCGDVAVLRAIQPLIVV